MLMMSRANRRTSRPSREPINLERNSDGEIISRSDVVASMRLEENTKKNYEGKIRRIVGFLESDPELKDSGCVLNGELIVPIREDVVKAIFFWLATDPSLAKRGRVASSSSAPNTNN